MPLSKVWVLLFSVFLFSAPNSLLAIEEALTRPTSLPIPEAPREARIVRVRLLIDDSAASIASSQPLQIAETSGALLSRRTGGFEGKIVSKPSGIQIGDDFFPFEQLDLRPENGLIKVGSKLYEGSIQVTKKSDQSLLLVNRVDLEIYLKGVLPLEVSPSWPPEALKAHAVASRTFALFKSIEKRDEDFDLLDTVHAQVYGGASFHKEETDEAVELTRGEVLTDQGEIFPAFFHANSGGRSAAVESVWRNLAPHPALSGVEDPYSLGTKHDEWSLAIPLAQLEEVLKAKGYPARNLKNVSFLGLDVSGRIESVVLDYRLSTLKLSAAEFREFLGNNRFKSLKVTARIENGIAKFQGFGWGHGVGMSQWGAKALAESGKTYREILAFYFPSSEIETIPS